MLTRIKYYQGPALRSLRTGLSVAKSNPSHNPIIPTVPAQAGVCLANDIDRQLSSNSIAKQRKLWRFLPYLVLPTFHIAEGVSRHS